MGDLPLGLAPNLRAGGLVVRVWVGFIHILVQHVKVGAFTQFHRSRDRSFGGARSRAQRVLQLDDVGPEEPQHRTFFERDLTGKRRGEGIPTSIGHHGKGHTGVPGGGLNKLLLWPHGLPRLPVFQEVRGDTIFHRAKRVVPLELGVDLGMLEWAHSVQANQRGRVLGVAAETKNRVVDASRVIGHCQGSPCERGSGTDRSLLDTRSVR